MAAVFTSPTPQGLIRTTAIPSPAADYSATWWIYTGDAPSGGDYETIYYYGDDPVSLYVQYVWIGRTAATGGYVLEVANGVSIGTSTPTVADPTPGLHYMVYTRTGNTHRLYQDFVLIATITINITAITATDLYLGTDTYSSLARRAAAFKEFDLAISSTQRDLESQSYQIVDPTLVAHALTVTPLTSDVVATTGTDWTNYNSTTFAAVTPTNFLKDFITVVGAPSVTIEDPVWAGAILWFQTTTPPETSGISFLGWADTGINYVPRTVIGSNVRTRVPMQFYTIPGDVWKARLLNTNIAVPLGGPLTWTVKTVGTTFPSVGIVIPPDAGNGVNGSVVIDPDTHQVVALENIGTGEQGDSLLSLATGQKALNPRFTKLINIYDQDFSFITQVVLDADTWVSVVDVGIRANVSATAWYAIGPLTGGTTSRIYKIDPTGAILQRWGPVPEYTVRISTSPDETVLYYASASGTTLSVSAWDLVNDVDLGLQFTLTNVDPDYDWGRDMLTLPDGSLLVYESQADDFVGHDSFIYRVSPVGVVLHTYTLGPGTTKFFANRINRGVTFGTFWVWSRSADTGYFLSRLTEFNVNSGSILDDFEAPEQGTGPGGSIIPGASPTFFGPSDSCPFFLDIRQGGLCPGIVIGPRIDGLPHVPVVNDPCEGSGVVTGQRTGT